MRTSRPLLALFLPCLPAIAQNTAVFPSDHASVEGSTFDRRLPFTSGATVHTQIVYEAIDLQVPNGSSITQLGFRRDSTTVSLGATLDLQVFITATTVSAATATNNFANNQTSTPVEVFTRKQFVLPDLGNPLNPNPNGNLVLIPLDVPFAYTAGSNLAVDYWVHGSSANGSIDYYLDKGSFLATRAQYGTGCTASNNRVPVLDGPSGNGAAPGTWRLDFSRGIGNTVAVLAVSFGSTPANPLLGLLGAPGCDLFVDIGTMAVFTNLTGSSGAFMRSFPIPDAPWLNDVDAYAQVLMLDGNANAAGMVVSNAYHTQFGMTPRMTTISTTILTAATGSVVRNNGIVSLFRYQ